MSLRLYDSAWVMVEGAEQPQRVSKDRKNPAAFNIGDYQYDIDGYGLVRDTNAPKIVEILSLQAVKEAGLRTDYDPKNSFGEI
jgi:hypothetical protein